MTFFRFLLRTLLYHWRGNLAVFLGVALGTAVLTGALLVGDSLRGSLRELVLDQLGWVDEGLVANRFFRAWLANFLAGDFADSVPPAVGRASAALILQGSAVRGDDDTARPTKKITVLGVDRRFWPDTQVPVDKDFWQGSAAEVVLNQTLAEALGAHVNDKFVFSVQKGDDIPHESLLGTRKGEDVVQSLELTVRAILPDQGMARFTLRPSPEPVRNAFVPLAYLQGQVHLVGRANALLVGGARGTLAQDLQKHLTLADWNLKLRSPADRARSLVRFLQPRNQDGKLKRFFWDGRVPADLAREADAREILTQDAIVRYYRRHHDYFLLESQQMLLEDAVVAAVKQAFVPAGSPGHIIKIGDERWWLSPTLIYLADSLSNGTREIPYAVVAGQGPQPQEREVPPQGNQIDLATWQDSPLTSKPGDSITLSYYMLDDHNDLKKRQETFVVRKLFPLEGRYDDPDLVPEFPGITDKLTMADWKNPPFPYEPRRVKPADENYWKRYRTTPRAYIGLDKAQELWGSRFGKLTSYRLIPMGEVKDEAASMATFRTELLAHLKPERGGFVFQDVRAQGLRAGGGSTDFGLYFLYFSFFLIVAALLLVGLLFRLNLDLRSQEIGVLMATGWTYAQVRRLLLAEGGLLAILGALVGLGGALLYCDLLLRYLRTQWPGEQGLTFLSLHVTLTSLFIGLGASLLVSFLTIWWAIRILSKMTPRSLLAGDTTATALEDPTAGRARWSLWIAVVSVLGAIGCTFAGMFAEGHEAQAGSFFGGGMLLLTTFLAAVWMLLRHSGRRSNPRQTLAGLGARNAGRHAVRSVLTVGLLGAATFLIVAVESFHKEAGHTFFEKTGGSGGFPLVGQADVPIFQDLNAPAVRRQLPFPKDADPAAKQVRVYPCRLRAGDDASCLNLYRPLSPRILGVPRALVERGGFAFGRTLAETDAEKANPWLLLEREADAVPILVDATTRQYILDVPLGGIVEVPDDHGGKVRLQIVGLFEESIFQSELVMAESHFRRLFPRHEGFSFFLFECPRDQANAAKLAWEGALADNGLDVESSARRLQKYLEVENTYLSTFQALGRLGLLLGAVGLAIVLLRGVWERRGELALLRALGFGRRRLAFLVLAENVFLLLAGLGVGTLAALVAVAPHLTGAEASSLWLRVGQMLALVIAVGLVAGLAAVTTSLRAPLLQALRCE